MEEKKGSLHVPASQYSARSSTRSKVSSARTPKVRKVNNFIIFYDELIGKGQFGTVVKAQLASDLIPQDDRDKKGQQTVRSTVDPKKPVYACKIFETENFNKEDM